MAFPDADWPCCEGDDDLHVDLYSSEKGFVSWDIHNFLVECRVGERKKLKSGTFAFGGAKWNFFSKFDRRKAHSLFGINIRGLTPSDSVLHCYCDIKFEGAMKTKNIIFKFICESADSHCSVEDFLSDSELDKFLQHGCQIECDISIKRLKKNDSIRSFAAIPFPESYRPFSFYPNEFTDSPMAFSDYPKMIPDSIWPCGGDDLKVSVHTPEEGCVIWKIKSFLSGCQPGKKELRSADFSFAGAKWNLFASFDEINTRSLFGLNIRKYGSSDAGLDCYCTITFKNEDMLKTMKHIVFKLKVESANPQCTVEDFLSFDELDEFLAFGAHIVCRFSAKKSSVKEVCSSSACTADISDSSRRNTFKAHAQLQDNQQAETQLQDNPTVSAPQSDSGSQPSGSVRSSAVLPPPPPVLPAVLPTSTSPYGVPDMIRMMNDTSLIEKYLGSNNPTPSAPQSDSGSQPSGSVKSSAVLPPPPPVLPAVLPTSTSPYGVPPMDRTMKDTSLTEKLLGNNNPTASAPQSDSGSQPSGSVRSAAVLPPPPPVLPAVLPTSTSPYGVPPMDRIMIDTSAKEKLIRNDSYSVAGPQDNSWGTQSFRKNVRCKIEEVIRQCGNPTTKSVAEMENHVFQKAKSKEEYLGFVARLIIHFWEKNPTASAPQSDSGSQPSGSSAGPSAVLHPPPPVLPAVLPTSTSPYGVPPMDRTMKDTSLTEKLLGNNNTTSSAPQSDSGSQPSGSVKSSAVLPPPPPVLPAVLPTSTSPYGVPPMDRTMKDTSLTEKLLGNNTELQEENSSLKKKLADAESTATTVSQTVAVMKEEIDKVLKKYRRNGEPGGRDEFQGNHSYSASAPQSHSRWKPSSLKSLLEESDALLWRSRYSMDPFLSGYMEPFSEGYKGFIPSGIAGQMPGVPGGNNRDPLGRNGGPGGRDEFQGNHSYSASAPQSHSRWKPSSQKSLLGESDDLLWRSRYSMDPLLSGYMEPLPGRHYSDPYDGYKGFIPPYIAGQMPDVPGGNNRDPLGRNGGPGGRDEFQGNHSYSASAPQSHSRWKPSSQKSLLGESEALLWSSRYSMDPLLSGYMEPLPGRHYSDPYDGYKGFIPPGIAGQMPDVPGGDNRDPLGRNGGPGGRDEFQGNHSYWASAPQSHPRWKPSSQKSLLEESDDLLWRSRYSMDPLLSGYMEPLPGRHYSDPYEGYRGFIPRGVAGQMPGVPEGDNRDPLGRNGGPGGRDEFQGNHKDDEELPLVSSKVFKDFKNLLQSGEGADVTLQVQDQQFKAHRIIITARSSVLASMIQNDMQGNACGVVKVEDCDPSSFPVLLEFLYCGGTEQLSVENVFSLYKSADKYDIEDLKMRCLQFIKRNLSVETFCKTLCISFEHPETNLLTVATEFFIRHFKQINSTSEWETFLLENPVKGNELLMETAKLKFQ